MPTVATTTPVCEFSSVAFVLPIIPKTTPTIDATIAKNATTATKPNTIPNAPQPIETADQTFTRASSFSLLFPLLLLPLL